LVTVIRNFIYMSELLAQKADVVDNTTAPSFSFSDAEFLGESVKRKFLKIGSEMWNL